MRECRADLPLVVDELDLPPDHLDDVDLQFVLRDECVHLVLHVKLLHAFHDLCVLEC